MIHTVKIDDSTENGKLILDFLQSLGIGTNSNIDPALKEVLLKSLEESKKGKLKSNEEVFAKINPLSIEQLNKMIDSAEDDSKNNRIKNAHDLKKDLESWS